jgi:hypothetical protein
MVESSVVFAHDGSVALGRARFAPWLASEAAEPPASSVATAIGVRQVRFPAEVITVGCTDT